MSSVSGVGDYSIHVAHVGNSIQYYNDCPRLLERMVRATVSSKLTALQLLHSSSEEEDDSSSSELLLDIFIQQNSCFKGGAHLQSLWYDGNGMIEKFASRPESQLPFHRTSTGTGTNHPGTGKDTDYYYDTGAPTVRHLFLRKNGTNTTNNNNNNRTPQSKRKMKNDTRKSPAATTTGRSIPTRNDDDSSRRDNGTTSDGKFWDYIIINDHTQGPVRIESKKQSKAILINEYLPTIVDGMNRATVPNYDYTTTIIFLQTAAYKYPGVKNSDDLGTFEDYTNKLMEGYEEYVTVVEEYVDDHFNDLNGQVLKAIIAPFGDAYKRIRDDELEFNEQQQQHHQQHNSIGTTTPTTMWSKLYAKDDYHPSPHGTFLEACLLHCCVTGGQQFEAATMYDPSTWWTTARYMQPTTTTDDDNEEEEEKSPLPLPTIEEAVYLNDIAYQVYTQQQQKETITTA